MLGPLPIFSQSDYLIQIIDINSHTLWQTVQIQISWFLLKPTDLDLHCLQRQGISGFSRTRLKFLPFGIWIYSKWLKVLTVKIIKHPRCTIFTLNPGPAEPCLCKQCRSRSVGFSRSIGFC